MNLCNLTDMLFPYPCPDGRDTNKIEYRDGELPPIFYVENHGVVVAISTDHVELKLDEQVTAYSPLNDENVYKARVFYSTGVQ